MGSAPLARLFMYDLRQHESDLTAALRRLERVSKFADVMAEATVGAGVRVERKATSPSQEPTLRGAVFRAWAGGRWTEAATSVLEPAAIARTVGDLERTVAKAGVGPDLAGEANATRQEWTERPTRPMSDLSFEETIALEKDILAWATEIPDVRECQVSIGWAEEERFYLNTAGARVYQVTPRTHYSVAPIAMENGRVEFDALIEGGLGGQEQLSSLTQERVREVSRGAKELLHAAAPPTGQMEVLLDPSTTGTLAHESFGHGTEADQFVRDRSYLKPILGTVVGPDFLTIIDNGAYPGGWGTIYCDDEGHPGHRTVLVDRGRFVGGLHDRETAAMFHAAPTGNARRADFLSRLFVRMTNTYVEGGDWSLEELISETKDGVLLERATSGIEDPQGGQMQLKVKKGYRIVNGERTELVSSMALSGKVLDVLKSARGVSRPSDFEMSPGFCGKGQTDILPVGSGGTYLLATAIVGPA